MNFLKGHGLSRSFLITFILLLNFAAFFAQIPDTILIRMRSLEQNDTALVNYLCELTSADEAGELRKVSDTLFTILNTKIRSKKERRLFFASRLGKYCQNHSFYFQDAGDLLGARKYRDFAIRLFDLSADTANLILVLNDKASTCRQDANYADALTTAGKALELSAIKNDTNGLVRAITCLGFVYKLQNKKDVALKFFKDAYKLRVLKKDKKGISVALNNMASIYKDRGKFDTALVMYRQSLQLRNELGSKEPIANQTSNIGSLYYDQRIMDSAEYYFLKAYEIRKGVKDVAGILNSLLNLSNYYFNVGPRSKAIAFGVEGLNIAKKGNFVYEQQRVTDMLADQYERNGDYKNALMMHRLFKELSDSLYSDAAEEEVNRAVIKSEFAKKELAIKHDAELKEKENQESLKRQRIITFSTLGGIGLTLFFLFLLYSRFKTIKKQKSIIEYQKKEVEEQRDVINEQKKVVEEHQKEIIDSIKYAVRIQRAHLPNEKIINRNLDRLKKDK
jgi:tetratricopeptide (TPR) repeat protein